MKKGKVKHLKVRISDKADQKKVDKALATACGCPVRVEFIVESR